MLEDPSYDNVVRWGEGGESFVVLDVRRAVFHLLSQVLMPCSE